MNKNFKKRKETYMDYKKQKNFCHTPEFTPQKNLAVGGTTGALNQLPDDFVGSEEMIFRDADAVIDPHQSVLIQERVNDGSGGQ